jgi:hypothetical protein
VAVWNGFHPIKDGKDLGQKSQSATGSHSQMTWNGKVMYGEDKN